jgi:lipoate-protein ligase A
MLHAPLVREAGLEVVRRFSGGGTVVVDGDTLFTSLIFAADALPGVACYPAPLMSWSESFYRGVFHDLPDFALRENGESCFAVAAHRTQLCTRPDYVLGARKFGGNAQCISKGRWVHHTSFLWDYQPALMACLRMPPRAPEYRQARCLDAASARSSLLTDARRRGHTATLSAASETSGRSAACWRSAWRRSWRLLATPC